MNSLQVSEPEPVMAGQGVVPARELTRFAALALAEPLALGCGCPAVLAQRSQADPGLVAYQFQLAERHWQNVTRADVRGSLRRDIIVRRFYGEQTVAEAAAALGIPKGTGCMYSAQALKQLRTSLAAWA